MERKRDGASFVNFPINRYICLIDEFDWFMDSYEIAIGSQAKEVEMAQYSYCSGDDINVWRGYKLNDQPKIQ